MTETTSAATPTTSSQGFPHGVTSEVGRLRSVVLHRPGPELSRLTPRNNDRLLFDGIPWVARAQAEHDAFAGALRERDVEVLYLAQLVAETLAVPQARADAVAAVLVDPRLGRHHGPPRPGLHGGPGRRRPRHPADLGAAPRRAGGRSPGTRPRSGVGAARAHRLRRRPAAEPAVHARLVRMDRRPRGRDVARDAGSRARDLADADGLHAPPPLRGHPDGLPAVDGARRGRRRPRPRAGCAGGRHR